MTRQVHELGKEYGHRGHITSLMPINPDNAPDPWERLALTRISDGESEVVGAELAQKMLGIRPDIPIILCTGQSELINREKALAMGVCAYLNKPVLQHDFLSVVRKALEKG